MNDPILSPDNDPLCAKASADQLRAERIRLGLKHYAVAKEVGISQTYLCDLEFGKRNMHLSMFHRIKAALEKMSK